MEMTNYYKKLTESLKLLSLGFEEQRQYFPDFVDVPFEVVDAFDNAFLLLPSLIEAKRLDYDAIADLLRLHNMIGIISSNPVFKDLDVEHFSNSEEWNKVRLMSLSILQSMGELMEKPDLHFL